MRMPGFLGLAFRCITARFRCCTRAEAGIVGKEKAEKWMRERLPTLANKPGFPPIDAFHGGRPVKLVARFYDEYLGTGAGSGSVPRGVEDVSAWKPSKRRA
jgi:hypothetical protein